MKSLTRRGAFVAISTTLLWGSILAAFAEEKVTITPNAHYAACD
jgi:hypothetical protein